MRGGPSHVDTFDYKPQLTADTDKPGKRPGTKLLGSKWKFSQVGKKRAVDLGAFSQRGEARGRDVPDPLDADGPAGASAGTS